LLADLADATGLTAAYSAALGPLRPRGTGHDPGRITADLAVMLADGGEATTDLAVLRDQAEMFGPIASTPTAWRLLADVDETALVSLASARVQAREVAWLQAAEHGEGIPAVPAAGRMLPGLVLDLDATLVACHSDKEQAAPTYKGGFGLHPLQLHATYRLLRPKRSSQLAACGHCRCSVMSPCPPGRARTPPRSGLPANQAPCSNSPDQRVRRRHVRAASTGVRSSSLPSSPSLSCTAVPASTLASRLPTAEQYLQGWDLRTLSTERSHRSALAGPASKKAAGISRKDASPGTSCVSSSLNTFATMSRARNTPTLLNRLTRALRRAFLYACRVAGSSKAHLAKGRGTERPDLGVALLQGRS